MEQLSWAKLLGEKLLDEVLDSIDVDLAKAKILALSQRDFRRVFNTATEVLERERIVRMLGKRMGRDTDSTRPLIELHELGFALCVLALGTQAGLVPNKRILRRVGRELLGVAIEVRARADGKLDSIDKAKNR